MTFLTQIDKGIAGFWYWLLCYQLYWLDEQFNKYKFYRRWDKYLDEMRLV